MIKLKNMEYKGRVYTVPESCAYIQEIRGVLYAHTLHNGEVAIENITTFSVQRLFQQDFLVPDVAEFLKRTTNHLIVGYRTDQGTQIWPLTRLPRLRCRSNPSILREHWGQYREESLDAITHPV